MCLGYTLSLFILLWLPLPHAYLNASPPLLPREVVHVAFLFAGCPRSFVHEVVRELIRFNLITAFCPPPHCIPHVFARVSLVDNVHSQGGNAVKDSKGVFLKSDAKERPLIEEALHRLILLNGRSRGSVDIRWVDIGSDEELEEMTSSFPGRRHRLFRELDPRRYSMFFGRWSVFQQAFRSQYQYGFNCSYFIHTRFDLVFGSPLLPYHHWSPNKIWLQNTWFIEVSDAFAILPSKLAPVYFSMEKLISPGIMCLGGPNFDEKTLSDTYLQSKGYSTEVISTIHKMQCHKDVDGIRFIDLGFSESILRRMLFHYLSQDQVGYHDIFAMLIRKRFLVQCDNLHPLRLYNSLRERKQGNSALFGACLNFQGDIKLRHEVLKCTSQSTNKNHRKCMVQRNVTDLNYKPFRICVNTTGSCLTVSINQNSMYLELKPRLLYDRAFGKHSQQQMFHLKPLYTRLQKIRYFDYFSLKAFCLNIFPMKSGIVDARNDALSLCNRRMEQKFFIRLRRQLVNPMADEKSILRPVEIARIESISGLCLDWNPTTGIIWTTCGTEHLHGFLIERAD